MKYVLIIAAFLTLSYNGHAQSIELKYVELADNKVVLHYDLLDSIEGTVYTVRLYSSSDGFLNSLEKVTGDVGIEIKSGRNRKITWSAREELGLAFEGKVALEIRGRKFIPFINTEGINSYKVYKRNRNYALTWSGGTPQNVLNFDLMKRDVKVVTFPNLANVGHHEFLFPTHVRPGRDYKFRISDSKNKDDVVYTLPFRIKRKVPLLLKALPAAAIGFIAFSLLNRDTGETPSQIADPGKPK